MNGHLSIEGIGLYGPGLPDWQKGRAVLRGEKAWQPDLPSLPAPLVLPPTERRRVGLPVRIALATGLEALAQAQVDPVGLATVFSSSGGDCDNCHHLLETLAGNERQVSPTRFHNSVHNAPSGYWSIATGCRRPSTSLGAWDGSFSAGLLETAGQVWRTGEPCLLFAYDMAYPEPLHALRPIPGAFGLALLLAPERTARSLASLTLAAEAAEPDRMGEAWAENLRARVPSARGLPLLRALACGQSAREVVIEYLPSFHLRLGVMP